MATGNKSTSKAKAPIKRKTTARAGTNAPIKATRRSAGPIGATAKKRIAATGKSRTTAVGRKRVAATGKRTRTATARGPGRPRKGNTENVMTAGG